jgi:hypothetical protein
LFWRKAFVPAVIAGVAVVATFRLLWVPPVQRASGPLSHDAYVWQRAWTPELRDRISEAAPLLRGLAVLVAEVSWSAGEPTVANVAVDWEALKVSTYPLALAVRINAYSGSFDEPAEATGLIADVADTIVRKAHAAGLSVAELQLDLDCPESRLAGYRVWVKAVRQRIGRVPVAVTVLPSWMNSPEFTPLVQAAGTFVLQVHSLQRARSLHGIPALCDPERSRRWVERAAAGGVPFRVALPTYSYLLAFDAAGAFLGASAETAGRTWPPGTQFRLLSSDPEMAASLVGQWNRDRPSLLTAIIWYRLPIETDRLNWRWETLRAIVRGESPRAELGVETRRTEQGLVEVELCNTGSADVCADVSVSLRWEGSAPIARDAIGEFEGGDAGDNQWVLWPRVDAMPTLLRPGERKMIAWMRFNTNREVQAHVTPNSK